MRKFWRVLVASGFLSHTKRVGYINLRHTSCAVTFMVLCGFAFGLSGSGVEGDPWVIGSLADFDEFAGDSGFWGGYVRLDVDIDLVGRSYTTAIIAPETDNTNFTFEGILFEDEERAA